jgi:hypothetical protein
MRKTHSFIKSFWILNTILSEIKMDFTEVAMLSERAFGKTVAVFAVLDNNGT